jgi:ADP-ribose pyrophosphatase
MTTLIAQREVFRGKITHLTVDTVDLPNGHRADLEILHHPGGAAIVALDDRNRVCLLHQFRHAAGGYVWELPAGKLEPDEPPELTAQRELIEEAGVAASTWRSLGISLSSPGVFTERIHLYLATNLTATPDAREAAEVFEVHWIDFKTAVQRVLSGEIDDSKTDMGLLRAWHVHGEKP